MHNHYTQEKIFMKKNISWGKGDSQQYKKHEVENHAATFCY